MRLQITTDNALIRYLRLKLNGELPTVTLNPGGQTGLEAKILASASDLGL